MSTAGGAEKKTLSINLKVGETLHDGYNKELTEVDREKFRQECRELLAKKIHMRRFDPHQWDLSED